MKYKKISLIIILGLIFTFNCKLRLKNKTRHLKSNQPLLPLMPLSPVEKILPISEPSQIPLNHPYMTYVEKLKYYEDQPPIDPESEAISMERDNETYYRPFSNKHLIYEAKSYYNCETISSPFVCKESSLCNWDNSLSSCFYTNSVMHEIRFKQRAKKRRHRMSRK